MSVWTPLNEQIKLAKLKLSELESWLDGLPESPAGSSEREYREAISDAVRQFSRLTHLIDVRTASPGHPTALAQHVQALAAQLTSAAPGNPAQWASAQAKLHPIFGLIRGMSPSTAPELEQSARAFFDGAKARLNALTEDFDDFRDDLSSRVHRESEVLRTNAAAISSASERLALRLDELDKRVDTTLADLRNSQQRHEEGFESEAKSLRELFRNAADELRQVISSEREQLTELRAGSKREAEETLAQLESLRAKAQEIMLVVSNSAVGHGHQREANSAKAASWRWQLGAVLGLLLATGLGMYVTLSGEDHTLVTWLYRIAGVAPAVLLFAYCASRASTQHRLEVEHRQTELALTVLEPYLLHFDDPASRAEIRSKLVARFFEQGPPSMPSVDPNLAKGTLHGIAEIIRAAKGKD